MAGNIQDLDLHQFKDDLRKRLKKKLVIGDTWYIVDGHWFQHCMNYTGLVRPGNASHPGPIDNTALFKDDNSGDIREKNYMIEDIDYKLVPEEVWNMLVEKFTIQEGQQPIARKVIETIHKKLQIELYLHELDLVEYSNAENQAKVTKRFSITDTVGAIENTMRHEFNIEEGSVTRLYTERFSSVALNNLHVTIEESNIWNKEIIVIEKMNEDGTWPRHVFRKESKHSHGLTEPVVGQNLQSPTSPQGTDNIVYDQVSTYQSSEGPTIITDDDDDVPEKAIEALEQKVATKIDELDNELKEIDIQAATDNENLEREHQETVNAITLKKAEQIAKILNQEKTDIEAEKAKFIAEKSLIEEKQKEARYKINRAIEELSKKFDNLEEEENADLKKEMECSVCLHQMMPPIRIFQCSSSHLICEECKESMESVMCPTCNEANIIGRALKMEKVAKILYATEN